MLEMPFGHVFGFVLALLILVGVGAYDLVGGLLLEVELLGSFSSACPVPHYLLFIVHLLDEFRSLGVAFRIDSLIELALVEILVELAFLSLLISENMEPSSRFGLFKVNIISDSRHDSFFYKKTL